MFGQNHEGLNAHICILELKTTLPLTTIINFHSQFQIQPMISFDRHNLFARTFFRAMNHMHETEQHGKRPKYRHYS